MCIKCLKTLSEKNRKNKRKTQQKQAKPNVRIHTYIFFSSINMTTKLTCIALIYNVHTCCTQYYLYRYLQSQMIQEIIKINIIYNILCIL